MWIIALFRTGEGHLLSALGREEKRRMRELVALTCSHRRLLLATGRGCSLYIRLLFRPLLVVLCLPQLYAVRIRRSQLPPTVPANRDLFQARKLASYSNRASY